MTAIAKRPRQRAGERLVDGLIAALPDLEPGDTQVFEGVSWSAYERLLVERDRVRPSVRLTYDRGRLEVMTVSRFHERWKKVLARLIESLTLELRIPIVCCGNLTIRREDLERGLEPDECYYVQHATQMTELRELDLTRDPPFDLVVEIEYAHSIDRRLPLLDSIGVREVWRYGGESLKVMHRNPAGGYVEATTSLAFPQIVPSNLDPFLKRIGFADDTTIVLEFVTWLRDNRHSTTTP